MLWSRSLLVLAALGAAKASLLCEHKVPRDEVSAGRVHQSEVVDAPSTTWHLRFPQLKHTAEGRFTDLVLSDVHHNVTVRQLDFRVRLSRDDSTEPADVFIDAVLSAQPARDIWFSPTWVQSMPNLLNDDEFGTGWSRGESVHSWIWEAGSAAGELRFSVRDLHGDFAAHPCIPMLLHLKVKLHPHRTSSELCDPESRSQMIPQRTGGLRPRRVKRPKDTLTLTAAGSHITDEGEGEVHIGKPQRTNVRSEGSDAYLTVAVRHLMRDVHVDAYLLDEPNHRFLAKSRPVVRFPREYVPSDEHKYVPILQRAERFDSEVYLVFHLQPNRTYTLQVMVSAALPSPTGAPPGHIDCAVDYGWFIRITRRLPAAEPAFIVPRNLYEVVVPHWLVLTALDLRQAVAASKDLVLCPSRGAADTHSACIEPEPSLAASADIGRDGFFRRTLRFNLGQQAGCADSLLPAGKRQKHRVFQLRRRGGKIMKGLYVYDFTCALHTVSQDSARGSSPLAIQDSVSGDDTVMNMAQQDQINTPVNQSGSVLAWIAVALLVLVVAIGALQFSGRFEELQDLFAFSLSGGDDFGSDHRRRSQRRRRRRRRRKRGGSRDGDRTRSVQLEDLLGLEQWQRGQ